MPGDLPELNFTLADEDQAPVVVAGDDVHASIGALLAAVPGLMAPEAAVPLAQAVLHFARGRDYTVIDDPAGFEADYRAQLAGEDANQPWRQGSVRLVDYGVPDFSAIAPPAHHGTALVCTARDAFSGLAYSAQAPLSDLSSVTLSPLPLTAVAGRVDSPEDPAIAAIVPGASQDDPALGMSEADDALLGADEDDDIEDLPPLD